MVGREAGESPFPDGGPVGDSCPSFEDLRRHLLLEDVVCGGQNPIWGGLTHQAFEFLIENILLRTVETKVMQHRFSIKYRKKVSYISRYFHK